MFAIFKREIRSYFQTVVGWLFIAAVLALYGLYFYAYNLRSGSPYVSYSLSAVSFIVIISFVPPTICALTVLTVYITHNQYTCQHFYFNCVTHKPRFSD